jgi:hypothetical protein
MNLPLQMRAVSRGPFSKSRIVSSAARVVPSWLFVCDPPMVACSCTNGSVACCNAGQCICDGSGNAGCQARDPFHAAPTPHEHAGGATGHCRDAKVLSCIKGDFRCFNAQEIGGPCQ